MRQIRSRTFMVERRGAGVCPRCFKRIHEGDVVRFHCSYRDAPVHAGCRAPRDPGDRPMPRAKAAVLKPIPLCQVCRLEHRGSCL